jgi:diguanylate cyclase (GGDEF)-like protein
MEDKKNPQETSLLQELRQLEDEIKNRDSLLAGANQYLDDKLNQLAVARGAYRSVSSAVEREKVTDSLLDLSQRILKGEEAILQELKQMREEYESKHRKAVIEANRVLDQKLYVLVVLKEAYRSLVSILDRQEVTEAVLVLLRGVIPYDLCGLLITAGEKERELLLDLKTDVGNDALKAFRQNIFQTFTKYTGEKVNPDKVETIWQGNCRTLIKNKKGGEKLSSFRAVTLLGKYRTLGLLSVGSAGNKEFSAEDSRLLSLIGTQAALGIENTLLHEKARELAITDELTNFFTRRHFQVCLDEEIKRCKRYKKGFSLVLVDLDNFKKINDNYGHLTGDRVISKAARAIKGSLREVDIAGRYGGEEFALLMPETTKSGAGLALERLRKEMEGKSFNTSRSNPIKLTLSTGVASYPEDGGEPLVLLKKADEALYQAKAEGKNCVCQVKDGNISEK